MLSVYNTHLPQGPVSSADSASPLGLEHVQQQQAGAFSLRRYGSKLIGNSVSQRLLIRDQWVFGRNPSRSAPQSRGLGVCLGWGMVKSNPFKRLILRAVLRDVNPMVIRLVSVSDQLRLPEFHDIFRSILSWGPYAEISAKFALRPIKRRVATGKPLISRFAGRSKSTHRQIGAPNQCSDKCNQSSSMRAPWRKFTLISAQGLHGALSIAGPGSRNHEQRRLPFRTGHCGWREAIAGPMFEMSPESESIFFLKMTGGRISFETGPDGRATSLIMHRADRESTPASRLS
jgi:hypothetical protein